MYTYLWLCSCLYIYEEPMNTYIIALVCVPTNVQMVTYFSTFVRFHINGNLEGYILWPLVVGTYF
jgi:hypothetical protein